MDIKIINDRIKQEAEALVKEADKAYYAQIERIAEEICCGTDFRPIILICGPSGSGKTTTALALERILDMRGHPAHTISMDNYFKTLSPPELELSSRGVMDLESPSRLDISLLNKQLSDMAAGNRS